jgi:hypothetical protein
MDAPDRLGLAVAEQLLAQGARALLDANWSDASGPEVAAQ